MPEPSNFEVTHAYTRRAVEEYLEGVEAQRRQLEAAIAHARARQTRARQLEERIAALENRVGESIVDAHVLAYERRGSVPHDDPATPPSGAGGEAESG